MATRIQHVVVDDLDQSTDGVSTYRFALEGEQYEIDLADHHIDQLRAALYPFIAAGRRQPRTRTGKATSSAPGRTARVIRQWWRDHQSDPGLPAFNARGSIPLQVKAAYDNTVTT